MAQARDAEAKGMDWLQKNWTAMSILVLVISAGWMIFTPPPGALTGGRIPAPREGFLAPDFALQDSSGQRVRLSDLRGKAVLVNFWASWCPPCKEEMPAMQEVYDAYAARGFIILAVNTTYQDTQTAALEFASSRSLIFPILFDMDGQVSGSYQVRAMPTSFFIRPNGTISRVVIGGPMSGALLRGEIERLLQEGG